jgi:hypothetical protein
MKRLLALALAATLVGACGTGAQGRTAYQVCAEDIEASVCDDLFAQVAAFDAETRGAAGVATTRMAPNRSPFDPDLFLVGISIFPEPSAGRVGETTAQAMPGPMPVFAVTREKSGWRVERFFGVWPEHFTRLVVEKIGLRA